MFLVCFRNRVGADQNGDSEVKEREVEGKAAPPSLVKIEKSLRPRLYQESKGTLQRVLLCVINLFSREASVRKELREIQASGKKEAMNMDYNLDSLLNVSAAP